jgi:ribosomal protein L7/L12
VGSKKKIKKFIKDFANPQILTLDEAFALRDLSPDPDDIFFNQDPDGRVVDAVLDRIGTRFSGPHNIDALTYGERLVLEVTILMGEVLNGGFHQYLWNSSGDSADETRQMLRDIGATLTAEMLDRVSGFFQDGHIPEEREERDRFIEEYEDNNPGVELFVEEDRAFYKSEENLYKLLLKYIDDHKEEFADPADDIVRKFKRQDRIRDHLGVTDDPTVLEEAEQSLRVLEARFEAMGEEFRQEQLKVIKGLLADGRKKEAIREYRSVFEISLSEAKKAVEDLERAL